MAGRGLLPAQSPARHDEPQVPLWRQTTAFTVLTRLGPRPPRKRTLCPLQIAICNGMSWSPWNQRHEVNKADATTHNGSRRVTLRIIAPAFGQLYCPAAGIGTFPTNPKRERGKALTPALALRGSVCPGRERYKTGQCAVVPTATISCLQERHRLPALFAQSASYQEPFSPCCPCRTTFSSPILAGWPAPSHRQNNRRKSRT